MKKKLPYLMLVLLLSCGEELPTVNPGVNSFSCLINGEEFIPEYTFSKGPRDVGTGYEILAGKKRGELEIGDGIKINLPDSIGVNTYTLEGISDSNNRLSYVASITEGNFSSHSFAGSITLTILGSGRMVGTFDFITNNGDTITNGAFDLEVLTY